jgi:transcriptional regulator with XRE-family HTH domain
MARKRRFRSGGLQALHDRFIGDDPERVASFERALADANVAQDIYNLRVAAGLSQRALAARVGTTASVISRLEDADYEGHSLSMLRRVAAALGRRVEVSFPVAKAPAEGGITGDAHPSMPRKLPTTAGPARRRAAGVGEPIGDPPGGRAGSKKRSKAPAKA